MNIEKNLRFYVSVRRLLQLESSARAGGHKTIRSHLNLLLFGGVVFPLLFVLLFFVFFFKLEIYFHIPDITIFQIVRYIKNRCGKFR